MSAAALLVACASPEVKLARTTRSAECQLVAVVWYGMARVTLWIEDGLLTAADRIAEKRRWSRSAPVREALRTFLKNETHRERQAQEREAYGRLPDDLAEVALWEGVASWPED